MSQKRVAVVGAGAEGLTAAIAAARAGARVTLLNAHPRIGLKILMSGGTRCNLTHREVVVRRSSAEQFIVVDDIFVAFARDRASMQHAIEKRPHFARRGGSAEAD